MSNLEANLGRGHRFSRVNRAKAFLVMADGGISERPVEISPHHRKGTGSNAASAKCVFIWTNSGTNSIISAIFPSY